MRNRTFIAILLTLLFSAPVLRAQGIAVSETITIRAQDTSVILSHDFILSSTLHLTLDSTYELQSPLDFIADERTGIVQLSSFFRRLVADTNNVHKLAIRYNYRPIPLQREVYKRKLVTITDTAGVSKTILKSIGPDLSGTSVFGKDFQQSGSVFRGFTIGSNRDLTLQSGLRLQFSGHITDSVEVLGALTDEQTPIQPEGTTQTLREIDNVFIEFRSPYVGSTLGKFYYANTSSEFTAFNRKFQGAKVTARYGKYGSTDVVVAVSPGRFQTLQINGREGDQGPYRLTDANGSRNIVVVAGTEHVYVDGIQMIRGEYNDYTIDYGTGEVFFQARRLITGSSRITVDFEYSDRQYSRSFIAVANTGLFFDSVLTVSANYLREADNQDSPIDITLSDADKQLLSAAGSDRNKAVRSGVVFVGRSDTVRGSYYRIDTVVAGKPDSVFYYAPEDSRSVYSISFSLAANGIGDYKSVAFGQYQYVGKGLGNYLPVVYLPIPRRNQIMSVRLGFRPTSSIYAWGEAAYSDASLNRFSSDPSSALSGTAFSGMISMREDSTAIGAIRLQGTVHYLSSTFQTQDRLAQVDFGNSWNTSTDLGRSQSNELLAEGTFTYLPVSRLELSGGFGLLDRGTFFRSLKQTYTARFDGRDTLPNFDYAAEILSTRDTVYNGLTSSWLKQRGGISYTFGAFTPGGRFEHQRRNDNIVSTTIRPQSFGFLEYGPELSVALPFMTTRTSVRFRTDDSTRFDSAVTSYKRVQDGTSQTFTLNGTLRNIPNLSATLDFSYRRKHYDSVPGGDPKQRLDNATLLMRSQTQWSGFKRGLDMDALYDVQTEQSARLQRLFLRVQFGQGQYIWKDLDSNGIQSDNEFYLTNANDGEYILYTLPTEQLYPVINLRTNLRVRIQPSRIIDQTNGIGRFLSNISSETTLRLEEKNQSRDQSGIYLLRFSQFQQDSATLLGNSLIQQDINLFESRTDINIRLRFTDRKGITQLYNATERTGTTEPSLRARWQPTEDIGLQLDLASTRSLLRSSDSASTRAFDLQSLSATNDFTYRPERNLELGWVFRITNGTDSYPVVPRELRLTQNIVRGIYGIETRGRIRLEIERTVAGGDNLGENLYSLPYQLTDGYAIGTTWAARLNFDYRFGSNLQLTVSYSGRAQPPSNVVIHTGQAEIRAFF